MEKVNNGKCKGRKKWWALIWWVKCGSKNVVELSAIPKKDRQDGKITTILWRETKTGVPSKFDAKIIAISQDTKELDDILLTKEGEISNSLEKLFSKEIIDKNAQLKTNKRLISSITKDNCKKIDEKISKDPGLFDNLHIAKHQKLCSNDNTPNVTENLIVDNNFPKKIVQEKPLEVPPENLTASTSAGSSHALDFSINSLSSRLEDSIDVITQSPIKDSVTINTDYNELLNDNEIDQDFNNNQKKNIQDESYNRSVQSFSYKLPHVVTLQDIKNQEFLLEVLKYSYQCTQKNERTVNKSKEISENYKQDGENRKEIAPGCSFYLSSNIINYIENKAAYKDGANKKNGDKTYDWQIIVREALLHVYGSDISKYSALGSSRGERPAINRSFYNGLYEWACKKTNETIDLSKYIHCINKLCGNKRRYLEAKKNADRYKVIVKETPNSKVKNCSPKRPRIVENIIVENFSQEKGNMICQKENLASSCGMNLTSSVYQDDNNTSYENVNSQASNGTPVYQEERNPFPERQNLVASNGTSMCSSIPLNSNQPSMFNKTGFWGNGPEHTMQQQNSNTYNYEEVNWSNPILTHL